MQGVDITPDSLHSGVEDLWGFSIRDTGGSGAVVNLREGADDGQIMFTVAVGTDASVNAVFPRTVTFNGDCYVEVASGTITGTLIYNPE